MLSEFMPIEKAWKRLVEMGVNTDYLRKANLKDSEVLALQAGLQRLFDKRDRDQERI